MIPLQKVKLKHYKITKEIAVSGCNLWYVYSQFIVCMQKLIKIIFMKNSMHVMFQFKSVFSINFRLSSCEISNIDSIKEAEKNNGCIMLHSIFVWLQHLGYVYLTFETVLRKISTHAHIHKPTQYQKHMFIELTNERTWFKHIETCFIEMTSIFLCKIVIRLMIVSGFNIWIFSIEVHTS